MSGFLLKVAPPEDLVLAVRTVAAGHGQARCPDHRQVRRPPAVDLDVVADLERGSHVAREVGRKTDLVDVGAVHRSLAVADQVRVVGLVEPQAPVVLKRGMVVADARQAGEDC